MGGTFLSPLSLRRMRDKGWLGHGCRGGEADVRMVANVRRWRWVSGTPVNVIANVWISGLGIEKGRCAMRACDVV